MMHTLVPVEGTQLKKLSVNDDGEWLLIIEINGWDYTVTHNDDGFTFLRFSLNAPVFPFKEKTV